MHTRTELGITRQRAYRSIRLQIGKSRFAFEAKTKRVWTTLDGDRSVLCLAAATTGET